jgi:capsular exopolysaccharide synthesis family protein
MDQETFALRDVLRILRHYRWLILTAIALAVLAALVISFAQPKRYTAETQLVLRPTIPDAALPDARAGDAGPLGLDLPAETQARIVASPMMTARVARRLRLPADRAEIKELTKRIQVKAVTDNLLLITVNAPTSVEAAALANGYAEAYLDYRQEAASDALQALSSNDQRSVRDDQQRVKELNQQIKDATARGASTDVARLTSERNAVQDEVQLLTRRIETVASARASEFSSGEIIAQATPPPQSSSPNPIRNVLIAVVLGGAAGVSFSLLREHVNDRVGTRDDAARAANAPVLAALPKRPLGSLFVRAEELISITAPESMASEAYRQLHRNLVRRGLGTQVRRLLVTSVESGSETSQTVANLGVLCARTGQAAMVIAGNLRRSRLHAYFQIPAEKPGLATVLANEDWQGQTALSDLSMALSVTERNLLVLPSGTARFTPGEVFSSARLSEILDAAEKMAQVLIIEAPPILGSDDALTLTAHADAVLLVLQAGVDKEGLTARAATILETAGSAPIGVVLHNAQKDDETVGWFERDRIGRDRLPASPSDRKWELPHVGNGHRSENASATDPDRQEATRLAFPEPHDDS